jgi:hypothetical protein
MLPKPENIPDRKSIIPPKLTQDLKKATRKIPQSIIPGDRPQFLINFTKV